MIQISLSSWASGLLKAGADAVFTPSKFVPLGDWVALRAALRAGEETDLPDVVTLVVTDAAMLDARDLRNAADQNLQTALTAARLAEETARSHREQLEQLATSMASYDAALSQLTAPSTLND